MARARGLRTDHTWPGFVDALATLLLVITFVLVVFMLAHSLLQETLSGRDEALQRLNDRIAELAEMLSMERQAAADMRISVAQLSASLQSANRERDELTLQLREAAERAEQAEAALVDANRIVEVGRETITARLAEIERLNRDIDALRDVRDDLEDEVAALALALDIAGREVDRLNAELSNVELDAARREAALQAALLELTTVRDRAAELVAQLSDQQERTALAQRELQDRELRLAELQDLYNRTTDELDQMNAAFGLTQADLVDANAERALLQADLEQTRVELTEEQRLSQQALQQVALLNQQLLSLRQQLQSLQDALLAAEARDAEQLVTIENLGQRLNAALAQRVEELTRYRSEFFGRLRQLLGSRADVTIVGDRFVFQSEVLFNVGEAVLGREGELQLSRLASALIEISGQIPDDIDWVVRVDGHTDVQPIATPAFPSNWELSTARAVSVVKFLILRGVPQHRLAATGFGEFQPLDPALTEEAYRRNRRIEIKLTER